VTFEAGKVTDVPVDLKPLATAPPETTPVVPTGETPAPAPAPNTRSANAGSVPTWAWFLTGTGAALFVAGAGFGMDALRAQSKLSASCKPTLADCTAQWPTLVADAALARERDLGKDAFIALGVSGVVGITAGVVGLVRARSMLAREKDALLVLPYATPLGGGLSARWCF
jgi:hypothetical protein